MPLRRGQSIFTPAVPALGQANTLLLARARRHFVNDFAGPLSIKYVLDGRAHWNTGKNEFWVDDSSFLVLNDGEPYSLHIDSPAEVETCCVFFEKDFVESIARGLATRQERLLDDPFGSPAPLPFISRIHRADHTLMQAIAALRDEALSNPYSTGTEDYFIDIANRLLGLYEEIRVRLSRLPASRASTRLELLKRVERGREFLHADPSAKVDLRHIAAIACLSPSHFHRTFKDVFGKTPHSYLSAIRLDRAMRMLRCGAPVTEVCFAVGFESLGSFSNLFRERFGESPSKIRKIR